VQLDNGNYLMIYTSLNFNLWKNGWFWQGALSC
jgi:hypothetical protein